MNELTRPGAARSGDAAADDRAWFKAHPARRHRIRFAAPAEVAAHDAQAAALLARRTDWAVLALVVLRFGGLGLVDADEATAARAAAVLGIVECEA